MKVPVVITSPDFCSSFMTILALAERIKLNLMPPSLHTLTTVLSLSYCSGSIKFSCCLVIYSHSSDSHPPRGQTRGIYNCNRFFRTMSLIESDLHLMPLYYFSPGIDYSIEGLRCPISKLNHFSSSELNVARSHICYCSCI